MTSIRKYMPLMIGLAVALVLALVAVFLLLRFSGQYDRVNAELRSAEGTLTRLHERNPFPSEGNVLHVRNNLEELEDYLLTLSESMSGVQIPEVNIERSAFPPLVERTNQRLLALATNNNVRVTEAAGFGLQRYAVGNLPQQEHVPRLVVQLRTIEALCRLLFEAQIHEFISIEREVFDVERTVEVETEMYGGRMRGMSMDAPDPYAEAEASVKPEGVVGLYTKERYVVTFMATDPSLRQVLNELAASPLFVIVKNVQMTNEMAIGGTSAAERLGQRLQSRGTGPTTRLPTGTQRRTDDRERPAASQLHEDRVVAGRERIRVRLDLDVYRFKVDREGAVQ